MESIKHKFRNNLFSKWQEVVMDKDVLSLFKAGVLTDSIAINEIINIKIINLIGNNVKCIIYGSSNRKIEFHSGAIKKFAQPYQNLLSLSKIILALDNYPNKKYDFILGSNKLYYFSLFILVISVPIVIFILYISLIKNKMPLYIIWKLAVFLGMITLFIVPVVKKGKSIHVKSLDNYHNFLDPYSNSKL